MSCEVWEAEHIKYRRRHALKVMLPSLGGERNQIGYLKHEYTVGRELNHEAVVRTDDYGTADGLAYLVMEYFPAPNLKQWMRDTNAKASQLAPHIVRSAASALAYMHEQGWIHRDVKPDNFLISEQGQVKLIDFTLARKSGGWLTTLLNNRSKAQGTLSYMSPEQIRNASQDCRADIYSFGCVIYELACGKPPYAAGSGNELLTKHLRSPVPSAKISNPNVTECFSNIVKQLLAKQPADRPKSMNEVIRQLDGIPVFEV